MTQITQTTADEYMESFHRAFIECNSDFIIFDGWSGEFLRECTHFGLKNGIIKYDEETSRKISDSQYTAMAYRLTRSGREQLEALK